MRKMNMTTKKSDGKEENSKDGLPDLSLQNDQKTHEASKHHVNFEMPLSAAIDEWWLTNKGDGEPSNKYTITSTGNGNVDISRN